MERATAHEQITRTTRRTINGNVVEVGVVGVERDEARQEQRAVDDDFGALERVLAAPIPLSLVGAQLLMVELVTHRVHVNLRLSTLSVVLLRLLDFNKTL